MTDIETVTRKIFAATIETWHMRLGSNATGYGPMSVPTRL